MPCGGARREHRGRRSARRAPPRRTSPTSLIRIDATSRPVGTTSDVALLGRSGRRRRDGRRRRATRRARAGARGAARPPLGQVGEPRGARRSSRPSGAEARRRRNSRASPGRTMSTAWTWDSGKRSERRRSRPVSIRRSSSSIRQRVTSHETNPSTHQRRHDADLDVRLDRRAAAAKQRRAASTITIAIVPRPPRTSGESGCSRCQAVSLTAPPPAPRRARPAGRAAARPRRASRPGIRASLAAAAVCMCTVASPNERSSGPARHVDELHPPVRHDREPGDQHAAANEQVVLTLGVAPRGEAPARGHARRARPRPTPRPRRRRPAHVPTSEAEQQPRTDRGDQRADAHLEPAERQQPPVAGRAR